MTQIKSPSSSFFEGQFIHLACLLVMLLLLYLVSSMQQFGYGEFLGVPTNIWVISAVLNAVIHQVYVMLCWRMELDGKKLTRVLGSQTFQIYQVGFAIFIIMRPILAFSLGWSNRGTLNIEPWFGYLIALILFIPSVYLVYCIRRYFGFDRAFGIDHFDVSYRAMPLVRQGIFNWTPNAMYVFGFLMLWVPAFLFQSIAALCVAAFSHAYIWVHYYCTEQPDMRRIYG